MFWKSRWPPGLGGCCALNRVLVLLAVFCWRVRCCKVSRWTPTPPLAGSETGRGVFRLRELRLRPRSDSSSGLLPFFNFIHTIINILINETSNTSSQSPPLDPLTCVPHIKADRIKRVNIYCTYTTYSIHRFSQTKQTLDCTFYFSH